MSPDRNASVYGATDGNNPTSALSAADRQPEERGRHSAAGLDAAALLLQE